MFDYEKPSSNSYGNIRNKTRIDTRRHYMTVSELIQSEGECCGTTEDVPKPVHLEENDQFKSTGELQQFSTSDNKTYDAVSKCVKTLPCGLYEIKISHNRGIYFEKIDTNINGIIRFPDSTSVEVLDGIKTFWEKEEIFKKNKLAYKRGVLLWGPPGSGKTCTIRLIIKDIIERNGIVVKFTEPSLFMNGIRIIRQVMKTTPIVVIMEDLDSYFELYNESDIINILDGVDMIEKVVFVATTNYPEKLGARVINRPSRFDQRYKIGTPNSGSRLAYFKYLFDESPTHDIKDVDILKWIKDTKEMSLAHLKELFVGTIIIGNPYDKVISQLKEMKDELSSSDDNYDSTLGFTNEDDPIEETTKELLIESCKHLGITPDQVGL
jgi:GTPase SAR1 family protein